MADPFKQTVREIISKLPLNQKGAFLVVMSRSIKDTWDAQIHGSPYLADRMRDMLCKRCTWPIPVSTSHVISCPGFPFPGGEIQEHLAQHFGIEKTYKSCRSGLLRHLDQLLRKKERLDLKSREFEDIPKSRRILMLALTLDEQGRSLLEVCNTKGDDSKTGILAFKMKQITLEGILRKVKGTVEKCRGIQSEATLLKMSSWIANVFGLHVEITSSPLTHNPDFTCWFSLEDQWFDDWKVMHYLKLLDELEGTSGLLTLTRNLNPFLGIWEKLKITQGTLPTRWLCFMFVTEESRKVINECVEMESKMVEFQVIGEAELEDLDKAETYAHPKVSGTGTIAVVLMQSKGMFTTHPVDLRQFYEGWKELVPKGRIIWKPKETAGSGSQEFRAHTRMGNHPFREEIYPFMFFRPLTQDYLQSLRKVKGSITEFKEVDDIRFEKDKLVIDSAIAFSGFHVLTNAMLNNEPQMVEAIISKR
jgi:hypothetical protein